MNSGPNRSVLNWNYTTHFLRLLIGPNEISVELALDVVALHTS